MPLELASLFQDHAVLQRGRTLPIWGWARPGAWVHVSLGGHFAKVPATESGDFFLRLPPLEERGPFTLIVETPETGDRLEVSDLLAGEVWLASGQSNMEWPLEKSRPLTDADITGADFPEIRYFNVPTRAEIGPHRKVHGNWQAVTPQTAGALSAVAFAFARRLWLEQGVPIGIVSSSWGGTIIQSWMSRPALAANPEVSDWLERYEEAAWSEPLWNRILSSDGGRLTETFPADPGNEGWGRGWHHSDFDDSAWPELSLPNTWQSAGHWHSGVYWFRRQVTIPMDWVGREVEVHLGAIDKQDISYANGVEIGRTGKDFEDTYWNVPRVYRMVPDRPTVDLAVRVYSFVFHGGLIGPASAMRMQLPDDPAGAVPLAGNWRYACEHNLGLVTETHVMGHGERNSPHMLFDNMIQPLVPYTLAGVIWYQGEANVISCGFYAELMRGLIRDWRNAWGQPNLPFHFVQLPGFLSPEAHQSDSQWARLREAQVAALDQPHTGLAIIIDLGEAADIHPKNKIPVGERLARNVLVGLHGRTGVPCGPIFAGSAIETSKIRCRFRHTGGKLTTTDGRPPRTFYVATAEGPFLPAEARIEGEEVVVWADEIAAPAAVRYAWANNPEGCNLAGAEGLPASPFRSDARS